MNDIKRFNSRRWCITFPKLNNSHTKFDVSREYGKKKKKSDEKSLVETKIEVKAK